jgi:hypothetical protein
MAAKPPISVRRPHRANSDASPGIPVQISHAPVPDVDPNGPEAMAYAMRGRMSAASPEREGEGVAAADAPVNPLQMPPSVLTSFEKPLSQVGSEPSDLADPWESRLSVNLSGKAADEDTPLISVKLPPEIGRRLAAVADRRGSKRTMVAIEVLSEPLRQLAAEHRAGRFPELPRIVSGTVRSSIAFALPPDLAADLEFVLHQRRAVRAQVVTRLLVPAIERLYAIEVGGRRHEN